MPGYEPVDLSGVCNAGVDALGGEPGDVPLGRVDLRGLPFLIGAEPPSKERCFLLPDVPTLDVWAPGEHTGTFRGERVATALADLAHPVPGATARGRGLAQGLELAEPGLAQKVATAAFDLGLLVETAGPADQVVKLLPPLTASDNELELGLSMLASAVTRAAA
jgi:4-aminobutyrate aminotransferase-like enzyme